MNIERHGFPFRANRLAMAVSAALLMPAAATGESLFQVPLRGSDIDNSRWEANYFEAGVGYNDVSGDAYKFGQYNGLYRTGAFAIVNMNLASRDGDTGSYRNLWGLNLGLPSRQLGGGFGTQGKWGLKAEFDQITNAQTDTASFIFNGVGSSSLTLRPGFQGITAGNQQPPANAANILPFEQSSSIRLDRDFFKVSGNVMLGAGFELTGKYDYQSRDGTKLTGAVMGGGFGNARSAILPYPIDDRTHQFELGLKFASPTTQFNLAYWYSRYSNSNESLTWQNPYGQVNAWAAGSGVGFPTGFGRLSLEPDNDFQQIKADFGYNFTPVTRLAATLQYSEGRQDQSYLPYTVNASPLVSPGLSVPIGLPQGSLNGKIDSTLFDLTLTTRPASRLFVKAAYSYDDRDNATPSNQYLYVGGDVLNQTVIPTGLIPNQVAANQIRTNLPIGTTDNKFTLEGDYNIGRGMGVRGWYQYRKTDYEVASQQSRADSDRNELGIEFKSRANEVVNGNIKYVWGQRRGAEYSTNSSFVASFTPATVANTNFLQLPTMRYFSNADYTQNEVKGLVGITPSEPVSVQINARWWQRDYDGPDCGGPNDQLLLNKVPPLIFPAQCTGLQKATGQVYTLDGQYAVSRDLNVFAFYTWSRAEQDQVGRAFASVAQGAPTAGFAVDPDRNWYVGSRTTDNIFGMGANWKPDGKPYEGGVQYLYVRGSTATSTAAGPALAAPIPIPDANSTMNSFQLFGKWQYSKNVLLRANYWFQRFSSNDWAYANATPVSSNNVLLTGQSPADYTANVFGISIAYTGW